MVMKIVAKPDGDTYSLHLSFDSHEQAESMRKQLAALESSAPSAAEPVASGYNRAPNGEPCSSEDWNSGYEAGLADSRAAPPAPSATYAVLPNPGSPEASAMIDSKLSEYGYPANPKNAARAGFEAARALLATTPAPSAASEREAFEEWLLSQPVEPGTSRWDAWQAGSAYRAALADAPVGYIVRHKNDVAECRKLSPDEEPEYLWRYTHGTEDLALVERCEHLEVKRVYTHPPAPEDAKDAALSAAAQELLGALQAMLEMYGPRDGNFVWDGPAELARAAIAKATGSAA